MYYIFSNGKYIRMPKKRQLQTEMPEYVMEEKDKPEKSKYSTKPLTKKKKQSKTEKMEAMPLFC